jgi:glyoxylase-like metal-dependent hydrolase (beta-lactamase superfamily II)
LSALVIDANREVAAAPELNALFSGDTLFAGGPGTTGRSYSDFPTIIGSIRDSVLTLPEDTLVHTGHGSHTSFVRSLPTWLNGSHAHTETSAVTRTRWIRAIPTVCATTRSAPARTITGDFY